MPLSALLPLLAAAFMHALWNFLLKRADDKYLAMGWQSIWTAVFAALALPFLGLPPQEVWGIALLSALLETVYFILLSAAYSDHDFSLTYPVARGAAPALLVFWAALFLGERPTLGGSLGLALILSGVVVIGLTAPNPSSKTKPRLQGIFAALSVALMISLYSFVDGYAVKRTAPAPYGLLMFALIPFFTTPYLIRKRGWNSFWQTWKTGRGTLLAGGALGLTAYLLALFAYSFAPLGYSSAIREISVVIGALLGWKFLNEGMGAIRLAGALAVFGGGMMIAMLG